MLLSGDGELLRIAGCRITASTRVRVLVLGFRDTRWRIPVCS